MLFDLMREKELHYPDEAHDFAKSHYRACALALRDIDTHSTVFEVSEVFKHFSSHADRLMNSDLPLLRLPYKACFFEGGFPPGFDYQLGTQAGSGPWQTMPEGARFKRMGIVAFEQEMGVYAWETLDDSDRAELERKGIGQLVWNKLVQDTGAILLNVMGVFHIRYKKGKHKIDLLFLNGGAQMLVNPMGQLLDIHGGVHTRFDEDGGIPQQMGMEWLATFVPRSQEDFTMYHRALGDQRISMVYPALVAIGMLNCKNVVEEQVTPSVHVQKSRKRKKKPALVTYRTLKLQLPGKAKRIIPLSEALTDRPAKGEGNMAYHRRRGHFKTFTEMRPLFGKFTGTYWWAPAMRGNPVHGRVIKDYEVEEISETTDES
jgi:hypothetical protein